MLKIRRRNFLMAQIITNQASLNYEYNGQSATVLSNVATALLGEPLEVSKISLEDSYRLGDAITYSVSFLNSSGSALTNVTVIDDLGSVSEGGVTVTPLSYISPAILLIDGVFSGNVTPVIGSDNVTFTIPSLPAGSRAQIIYKSAVNSYASISEGSEIINTVTLTADGFAGSVTDSDMITVESYADVTVTKTMTPTSIVDGDTLTYTFVISNFGNAPATNIVLSDSFDPAPENISVQVNGTAVPATDYTYVGGVLTFPADTSAYELSLPAATFVRDPVSGLVTITPSSLTVSVVGVI